MSILLKTLLNPKTLPLKNPHHRLTFHTRQNLRMTPQFQLLNLFPIIHNQILINFKLPISDNIKPITLLSLLIHYISPHKLPFHKVISQIPQSLLRYISKERNLSKKLEKLQLFILIKHFDCSVVPMLIKHSKMTIG